MALHYRKSVSRREHALIGHHGHRRVYRDELQAVDVMRLDRLLHKLDIKPFGLRLFKYPHGLPRGPGLVGVKPDDRVRRRTAHSAQPGNIQLGRLPDLYF